MSEAKTTVYEELRRMGAEVDSHESDLYTPFTPEAVAMIRERGRSFRVFRSNIDGRAWLDVPFAFDPFWDKVRARAEGVSR